MTQRWIEVLTSEHSESEFSFRIFFLTFLPNNNRIPCLDGAGNDFSKIAIGDASDNRGCDRFAINQAIECGLIILSAC